MRRRVWKRMLLAGMLCAASLAVYGCKAAPEASEAEQTQEEVHEEPGSSEPGTEEDTMPVEAADTKREETSSSQTDEPILLGDISELGDMQFTVVEAITEETDDGSLVMAAPASSADSSDFAHVTVAYDENTVFYIRTIYDNGARYEDAEASAEDLEPEKLVNVWGSYEKDGERVHADKVQIDKFVR